ncbi:MAG: aldo/keto reductase [Deltaproteobacteria bacterium]|nr:aldo/keto reductase [Deltaproteobacteria bacterium]
MVEKRRLGSTEVAPIGQGTWHMELDDRASAIAALRRGLDVGMRHIDTAEMYGDGEVERIVGEAIEGRRDEVFLVSKVLPWNATRAGTRAACERSLARLGTDRLDLYLLHWPGEHPLEDTIAGLESLRRDGKIRAWGVSNFDAEDLERAVGIAGEGKVACNQVLYHLRERSIEHAVIPFCEKHGIAVVGYSPFGSGNFPSATSKGGRALAEVASAHGATPRQVALRFLVRLPSLFTIPKSSRLEHVVENAGAANLTLDQREIAAIDAAFPLGPPRRGVPVL